MPRAASQGTGSTRCKPLHLEVQVRAGGVAHSGDQVADHDPLSWGDLGAVDVTVEDDGAIGVS